MSVSRQLRNQCVNCLKGCESSNMDRACSKMPEYASQNTFIEVTTFPKFITCLLKLVQLLNHWGWQHNTYTFPNTHSYQIQAI